MENLITRAKARDPEALAEIYERYRAAIYRYIYFKVHDVELAEDLTSDVFLQMLEGIEHYDDRGMPIGSLLFPIARYRSIDMIRKQKRRVTVQLEPWHKMVNGPEARVIRTMEYDELRTMLKRLTTDQRRVLELRFWGDLDISSTAMRLGKTRGAVKALQHRAVGVLNRLIMA